MRFGTKLGLSIVAVLVTASGCGDTGAPSEPSSEQAANEARDTVFDPLVDSVERARAVQQTLDDAAAERRRQIDAAEGQR